MSVGLTAHDVVDDGIDRRVEVREKMGYQGADGDYLAGARALKMNERGLETDGRVT